MTLNQGIFPRLTSQNVASRGKWSTPFMLTCSFEMFWFDTCSYS